MPDQPRYEKDEKEEKDRSKHDEKTVEEKWRRDPLGSITWAVILIWAGLVFFANNLGWFNSLPAGFFRFAGDSNSGPWSIIFIGAGVILLIEAAIRLAVPAYRRPIGGTLLFAIILIGIGLGNITNWEVIWPLIIIAIGVSILLGGFWRRRS